MVLRCSLLGHDYGEPDVEREREERGSEVVVTVQEFEECTRCGDRHVISENTEVTSLSTNGDADVSSLESPPESGARPDDASAPTAAVSDADANAASDDTDSAGADGTDGTDAEFIDADADDAAASSTGAGADAGVSASANANPSTDAPTESATDAPEPTDATDSAANDDLPTDENGEPITDDGEILEETVDEPADRGRGEWPETDDVGPPVGADDQPTEWPDADGTGDGAVEDDAVVLEHDSTAEAEPETDPSGPSVTHDAVADDEPTVRELAEGTAETADGTEPDADSDADPGPVSGIERAADAPVPADDTGPDEDVPMEYYCPSCDYVAAENRASLRAGDICPECRKGYLGERPRR